MPYQKHAEPKIERLLQKLAKKAPQQVEIIGKKVDQICNNPFHNYHRMHGDEHGKYHVHIDNHFVLIFRIKHKERIVELLDYGHHDEFFW